MTVRLIHNASWCPCYILLCRVFCTWWFYCCFCDTWHTKPLLDIFLVAEKSANSLSPSPQSAPPSPLMSYIFICQSNQDLCVSAYCAQCPLPSLLSSPPPLLPLPPGSCFKLSAGGIHNVNTAIPLNILYSFCFQFDYMTVYKMMGTITLCSICEYTIPLFFKLHLRMFYVQCQPGCF